MLFPDSRVQPLAQKRRFWFYVRASLLVAGVVVVSVAATGTAFQAISTDRDTRHLGVAGRLVDMTGYKLHLHGCLSHVNIAFGKSSTSDTLRLF